MGKLRAILDKRFSEKKYPNPKAPEVAEKNADGRRLFEHEYLGKAYPWVLAGKSLSLTGRDNLYCTHAPFNRDIVVGKFPKWKKEDFPFDEFLRDVREAGLNFFKTVNRGRRIKLLLEISKIVEERFWLLCAAKMYETGQSLAEAIGETDEEVDFPLATAMYLEEIHEDLLLRSPSWSGDYNGKRYVPHGTFLNIEPFNFPGAIPMDMAVKALAMGNAVIMKPSDKSSLCGYLVYESVVLAFQRLGIPHESVVNYCPGGPEVVDMLLQSPDIAGVSFTGSSAALDEIKRKHGTMLRNKFRGKSPLAFGSAETSGVNVSVVWKDANISYAAAECAKSFLGRSGQKCSSARVIMVHKDMYDSFSRALEKEVEKVRFGNVLDGADLGPVITPQAEQTICERMDELTCHDITTRRYVKLSNVMLSPGLSLNTLPTILYAREPSFTREGAEVDAHTLMNTEIFGPVTTVVSVPDLATVKKLCNFSEFALTGTSFTNDPEFALELADIIPAGNLYFNRKCTGALVDSECFGGLSSRSSPTGVKGKNALVLFGSQQTISGFYPTSWSWSQQDEFIYRMGNELNYVFSKI
ncbi:hypothetical protein A2673_02260 [Candidatus Kaiserbacteria bacterium RIFCSPHIGHO2_01_FULL_50_13]|uniref:Aldehyde dehydrogenase domain-containing protein n=1 Tax=Candidatus Kaiserbacteria bacterium RIFCSPLOWO2_01_FULL_50_24 TaxID=1798507 RepID=A0A1F6ER40_9BACT|nr:MAG: hypothetical protein A2673_02260 [Candidatus Kaiserbacteria bacterium RIFCSPHIGHO2_01_FULL_50_13]OGG76093.1 MAG: hypothetical protein A3A34_00705 [Candidatus Kaiserbacteria bacterium RIFCSPLOWO2_01_FULL_50_24]OGG82375.1 MAG: hypothetical protein A3H74_00210 [Candidatus Kaiserbacteria bacterium RIFCSPLOWO2_02_FULL_51_13]